MDNNSPVNGFVFQLYSETYCSNSLGNEYRDDAMGFQAINLLASKYSTPMNLLDPGVSFSSSSS